MTIKYIEDFDRETMMKQWDSWRKYIAKGGGGSWPRDAFEGLLDYFEERLKASQPSVEADAKQRCDDCLDWEMLGFCNYCGGCGRKISTA